MHYRHIATLFIALLGVIYARNVFLYTTHFAYDGGAHIAYVESLQKGEFPAPDQNYLAWHEPLYYALAAFFTFPFGNDIGVKVLEFGNALFALLFVMGSGTLAFLVTKNERISLYTMIGIGSMYVVSALGRYVTNEMLFHTLAIWFFALFWYWDMHDAQTWTKKKWLIIALYLSVMLWVKLSAAIIILALVLWLLLKSIHEKKLVSAKIAVFLVAVSAFVYSPWLMHKQDVYGQGLTINNFETESSERMPLSFYLNIDTNIFRFPFYTSGNRSFWSMLYASALGDYDNIFQNYNANQHLSIQTSNGRWISLEAKEATWYAYVFSLPLWLFVSFGLLIHLFYFVKDKGKGKLALLTISTFGFLAALMYNTYVYPHLERGTLKALFIITFFPLALILGLHELSRFPISPKKKRLIVSIAWAYLFLMFFVSLGAIILPA